jgi:hypothetical protein
MKRAVLVLALVTLLPWQGAAGQGYEIAPVQVEVLIDARQYSYDCYPAAGSVGEGGMVVYFNTPNGLAVYACDLVGRVLVIPAVPIVGFNLANHADMGEGVTWRQ